MRNFPQTIYYAFPGGKFKCLTMSYDDGREEDRKLVSIFNKYGIRGTFHINSALSDMYVGDLAPAAKARIAPGLPDDARVPGRVDPSEFKELYAGHEVSCHTATHPTIARSPIEHVAQQVLEDRKALEKLVGYPVRGLSYPNGSYNDEIKALLPALGIKYSRVVETTGNFGMPTDFLEWKGTTHHNRNLMQLGEQFLKLGKFQYMFLMYVWGHSYEFSNDNNWDLIEDFCKMMGGKDDIWYATNIEIYDYMQVCKNLQFSADGTFVYNPSAQSAFLSLDGTIVEVPGGAQVNL